MSLGPFIIILLLIGLAWVFVVRPSRRRRDAHAAMQDSVEVGDEIITAGGLHATVREAGEDQLRIEIAPGVVATLDRRAVAAVARDEPEETEEPEESEEEASEPESEAQPR
jgi:preprotein translocase subunit YajC